MKPICTFISLAVLWLAVSFAPQLQAQQPDVSVVVEGLKNPFAVAVEPETDDVYVSESGELRIVKIVAGEVVPMVTGFDPVEMDGFEAGPLGLHFVARGNLLVGHGEDQDEGQLSRFEFAGDQTTGKRTKSIYVRQARQTLALELRLAAAPLGLFRSICAQHANLYVVTSGDTKNGWIAMSEFQKEKMASFRPAIATTEASGFLNPTSAIVPPDGGYLIVAGMGEKDASKDSHLAYYSLQGRLLDDFAVELEDLTAIAIGPNQEHLFAIDHCFSDPSRAGLYKLIAAADGSCAVKKMLDIPWAVAMDFDSNGSLYVTTLGGPANAANASPIGKLLKIDGLDVSKGSPR